MKKEFSALEELLRDVQELEEEEGGENPISMEETFASIEKTKLSLEKQAYDGTRDILKYFDRIHDKLFTFNNIIIAGFFAIAKLKDGVPMWFISVPIVNLGVIIYIEFKMMEKSRMEAKLLETFNTADHGSNISSTTRYSLLIIFTTFLVTAFFLYNLLK